MSIPRRFLSAAVVVCAAACAGESFTPPAPSPAPTGPLMDRAAVIDALDYWQAAVGITYELIDPPTEPRLLVRPGTDGLGPQGGGRGGIDGTYPEDNRARSGLVVIEPGGGSYCRSGQSLCRYLYRHEIGHAFGFLGHSDAGLMASGSETLSDTERRMMVALYSLPHGAVVAPGGSWSVPATGQSGVLDDVEAAAGIILWNMNAQGSASSRERGIITRWDLPVRVYIREQ
jgi:hypothetical protein